MAGFAVAGDTEGRIAIVAGAARLASFHLLHADLIAVGFGSECAGMTFITTKHPGMNIVAKNDFADSALDSDIFSALMAVAAVTLDAECGVTIMTSAA